MSKVDEKGLESHICDWLASGGGYQAVKVGIAPEFSGDFDAKLGLDTVELFSFIEATQTDTWDELAKRLGGDAHSAKAKFPQRLASEIDKRGTVDVLRHGVVDHGITIRLAYFKPAHGLTPELVARYDANRLTVTRQLPYEAGSTKTLDMCLFVNGLPVATAELKNAITGQGVEHAVRQYRSDRDPSNVTLARRAVVHFAADTEHVMMTTRLAGKATRFLPFNRGHNRGKGNPPNSLGHRTAYLWERVWTRHEWMDMLARFVHVEKPSKGSRAPATVIFPRFHQWDCVQQLEIHARAERAGNRYLIQHSAGSGKSNTIAWLAHRLSSLHDAGDHKVFDKVIVITDRIVLDRQLQDTIYQFEHAHGVVERIDKHSSQLADALGGEQARIIITTLQKFPFVLDKIEGLPARRYAIIVDEAHSSQTGKAAEDLKKALGLEVGADDEELTDPMQLALEMAVSARGQQPNLSFFAFTATPKGRTLELFGGLNTETNRHEPFHLYSMRQAIEEGFIEDVLENYITYETYWHIEKAIEDDPAYETAKARKAIARFVTLHEHNLAQKAEITVEHFRQHVSGKVAGRAKAMVVTSSRLHAVRFHQALRGYIDEQGYDLGVLVAFSGTVSDGGIEHTESSLNGFPESQTAERFDGDEHRIMVVAEKFQTGFDQPKLYAMYVDKTLTGLGAVQTLSRLNRIHPDKDGTFVLDFVNDAGAIADEFEMYYGKTVAPPSDPNLLYDTRQALEEFGVLHREEVANTVALLVAEPLDHGRVHASLEPAKDRFAALEEDEQERFRDALSRFVRIYSFLSQIVSFKDTELERDYLFCRALYPFIRAQPGDVMDISDEVELTHLRHEKDFEGSVSLTSDEGEVKTIFSGTGKLNDDLAESLSEIIERLNAAFGTDWTDADRLVFDATAADLVSDEDVQRKAVANTRENFDLVFGDIFEKALLGRMDRNEKVVFKFLDDKDLATTVLKAYAGLVQGRASVAYQEHCPIGELLGAGNESQYLEYKATLRTHSDGGEVYKPLESASLKTIAAFLNSREGGTLLIGVNDDGSTHGLAGDYTSLHKEGKDDRDRFELHLSQLLINAVGEAAATNVTTQLHKVNGHELCRVHVRPSGFPIEATIVVDKKGNLEEKQAFFVRLNNGTREIADPAERQKYILNRWGASQPVIPEA